MTKNHLSGAQYLSNLMAKGIYTFTTNQAQGAFQASERATIATLWRLKTKGLINTPFRGFHVIVPAEYRAYGCLPAEEFVPDLMHHLSSPYYAGLLTAAQYHGAAHQKPQYFQVLASKNRKNIECGRVRVFFIARRNVEQMATETRNTSRGMIRFSTPETTAIDLVTYPEHAGGLGNVATVLSELSEKIDPKLLLKAAKTSGPIPYIQRLGYLFDYLKKKELAAALSDHIERHAKITTPLVPSLPRKGRRENSKWKLIINSEIEIDL